MILEFHGRPTSVAEASERCLAGRDGANASDVAKAARSYGLRVDAYSLELDQLADLDCPAILHWGFKHFVVLERWTGRDARIVDPARGRRKVSRQEVSEQFTGVALSITPGARFDPSSGLDETESSWRLLARRAMRARGVKPLLRQILLTSLLLELLSLVSPLLTKTIVDDVLPSHSISELNVIGLGIAVIVLVRLTASLLRSLVLTTTTAKLDAEIMVSFVEHVFALPFRYFQEHSAGDLLNRLSSNTQIRSLLSTQMISSMLDGLFVVIYGVALFAVAPLFGSVVVAFAVVQVALIVFSRKVMTLRVVEELAAQSTSQAFLVEAITGIESVKAGGVEDRTLTYWSGLLGDQLEASMRRARLASLLSVLTSTVQAASSVVLLWLGASMVVRGQTSLGSMLALLTLSQLFLSPVSTLVGAALQFQQIGGHLERIANVLRAQPEQQPRNVNPPPRLTGAVEFDDVWFRYDESSPWAVRDFTLTIEAGQRVALVGRTGSGKSTLAKLLLGLQKPSSGAVRVDGYDLTRLDLRAVREQFGAVMQDPAVFNTSLRSNISGHDQDLSLDDVERAARIAELHDDVAKMPLGFDTVISEGGAALSGGQRQRLALARGLAHRPPLLVLDEATSNLDVKTEARVTANLADEGCTMLIVAHRLSTVRDADVILVMDEGLVVERGSHDELVAGDGLYAEMVREASGLETALAA